MFDRMSKKWVRGLVFWVTLGWCGVSSVHAGNAIQWTHAKVDATIHHIGLIVEYTDDDNTNATAQIRYRKTSSQAWKVGHRLLRLPKRRWAGSLFHLEANTEYTIEVTLKDPDGSTQRRILTKKTRADTPPVAPTGGRHLYVDGKRGQANAPGTKAQPLRSIQKAVERLQPGDTLHILPSVYHESITLRRSGTATRPITIVASGQGVILDGSDPALLKATWKHEGDGIYSTAFSKQSRYVAAGNVRLYDYTSLSDLRNENGKQPGQKDVLKGGFFVDSSAKKIYIRLPDRSHPDRHTIYVAVLNVGIRFESIHHVIVRGLEIRYFGGIRYGDVGIDIRNSYFCWIQKNYIHHTNNGILVRKTQIASDNVIEDNRIRDTSVWSWPWSSVKAKTAEASAIHIQHGERNIVRRNYTEGTFNGIVVGSFANASDETIARNTDVYDNILKQHADDALEPEGACVHVRFVRNSIVDVHNGLSLAPIRIGPLWAIRTTISRFKAHALKLNNGSTGWMLLYHTTSIPASSTKAPSAQTMAPSRAFHGLIARNNIWMSNRYIIEYSRASVSGPISLDYDLVWSFRSPGAPWFKWLGKRYATLADFKNATGFEQHGIAAKPTFEQPKPHIFLPAQGSPMLDKGVVIEGINRSTFQGKAPDIGAWERGAVQPPKEPSPEHTSDESLSENIQTEKISNEYGADASTPDRTKPENRIEDKRGEGRDALPKDTVQVPDLSVEHKITHEQTIHTGPEVVKDTEVPQTGCQCQSTGYPYDLTLIVLLFCACVLSIMRKTKDSSQSTHNARSN